MSRKTSSSAPSAAYSGANSTGSPASRSSTKETPLTTRPLSTSKQGITRLVRGMHSVYRQRSITQEVRYSDAVSRNHINPAKYSDGYVAYPLTFTLWVIRRDYKEG